MTQAQRPKALQSAGAVALRLACEGDEQAAETIRAMNARIVTLRAENEQLRAQLASEQQDAARYRWAREQAEFFPLVMDGTGLLCAEHAEAEAEIDAAIAAAPKEPAP